MACEAELQERSAGEAYEAEQGVVMRCGIMGCANVRPSSPNPTCRELNAIEVKPGADPRALAARFAAEKDSKRNLPYASHVGITG